MLKSSFIELRDLGHPVKARWFFAKAKDLFKRIYPHLIITSATGRISYGGFKFSKSWFRSFLRRQHISLRKRTNQSQKQPEEYREPIQCFHQFIRKVAEPKDHEHEQDIGKFKLKNIANMDQTPMPFEVGTDITYNDTGARTVWVKSLGSGLDKRQATVQLTVHADGMPHSRPMVVFRGKGLRITSKEKTQWDKRVVVKFQENVWVDETIGLQWVQYTWRQTTFDPRLLVLDVHRAQKTDAFLRALALRHTTPAFVPPGCTGLVQPLDVALNKPFKDLVDTQYNTHFEENLNAWVIGKISASERRILMTRWTGSAWAAFCTEYQDTIRASFVKCGIAVPIDGSQDSLINIRGLTDYYVPSWKSNKTLAQYRDSIVPDEVPDKGQSVGLSQGPDVGLGGGLEEGPEEGPDDGPDDELDISGASISDCFTEGTPSHSGSDCEDDDDDDDVEVEQVAVSGSSRRLQSSITLGEEIM